MSSNQYVIGPVQRLIDLNGEDVNFEVKFTVKSNDDFYAGVARQEDIDKGQINLSRYSKVASGTASNKSNKFSNYFLVLKSPKETSVTVTLERNVAPVIPQASESSNTTMYYGLAALLIIGAAFFLFSKKKSNSNVI